MKTKRHDADTLNNEEIHEEPRADVPEKVKGYLHCKISSLEGFWLLR